MLMNKNREKMVEEESDDSCSEDDYYEKHEVAQEISYAPM